MNKEFILVFGYTVKYIKLFTQQNFVWHISLSNQDKDEGLLN